jgi:hypothetical protein
LFVRCDANPGISDLQDRLVAMLPCPYADRTALRGELDRVVEPIIKYAAQVSTIAWSAASSSVRRRAFFA